MEWTRNWLLPVLLAAAQLALWPGVPMLRGQDLGWLELTASLATIVLAAVALGWRRRAPVAALGGVIAAVSLGTLATPTDSLAIIAMADMIGLFSVAVRRPMGTTLALTGALVVWQVALNIPVHGTGRSYFGIVILVVAVYLLVAGLGHSRARWLANRRAAARRLAEAEAEQRQAAAAERQRLARELHDVSAHHLTSIVVTATAAGRLAERRPELAAEALAFSAKTGRETLEALRRLVAVMRTAEPDAPQPLRARIEELAAGFVRLGQPVTVQFGPPMGDRVGEVLFAVAREALTNALRYAPGAAVRVLIEDRGDAVELLVEDDGTGTPKNSVALGSGRGVAGMRERAEAIGGTLSAGRGPGGGWQVRALLPVAAEPVATPRHRRWWRRVREQRLVDAAIAVAIVVFPFGILLSDEESVEFPVPEPRVGALLGLLVAVHAVPLLWRRHAPWAVLAAVIGTSALWPLAAAYAPLSGGAKSLLAAGGLAEFAVVYAVAAYGRRPWTVWLAIPLAALGLATAMVSTAAVDGSIGNEPATPLALLIAGPIAGVLAVPMVVLAVIGLVARRRRDRVLAREQGALSVSTFEAGAAAQAERRRIAAGLHEAVLHRAGRVVTAADEGDLDRVTAEARSALAAMRELLDSLRDTASPARRGPQSTAAAIDALCGEYRAAGREITLDSPDPLPELPADIDVSVFRVVEAALSAGDEEPAVVALRCGAEGLVITVTGVPGAVTGGTVAGLRARMAVVGGRLATEPAGTVRVWLPVRAGAAPLEEVAPSPSG